MQKDVETLTALGEAIKAALGSAVHSVEVAYGELTLRAETADTLRVRCLRRLRSCWRQIGMNAKCMTCMA